MSVDGNGYYFNTKTGAVTNGEKKIFWYYFRCRQEYRRFQRKTVARKSMLLLCCMERSAAITGIAGKRQAL